LEIITILNYIPIMPNDCVNEAVIRCPNIETYEKLLQSFKKNIWFETFCPIPPDDNTNDTRNKYWGTKWEAYEFKILRRDKKRFKFVVWFLTAWCPPTGVYSNMKKNFNIETTAMFRDYYFGNCKYTKDCEEENFYEFPDNITITELKKLKSTIDFSLYLFVSDMFKDIQECLKDKYKEKKSKLYNEIKKIEKEITETKTEHNLLNIAQRKKTQEETDKKQQETYYRTQEEIEMILEIYKKYREKHRDLCNKRKEYVDLCKNEKEYQQYTLFS
jgi:hypothetical protein